MNRLKTYLLVCTVAFPAFRSGWSADTQEILDILPSDTNLVSIIRVSDMLSSPRAQREGWQRRDGLEVLGIGGSIPSDVNVVIQAARIVPGNSARSWTATLFPCPRQMSMTELAQREMTQVDSIAGAPTVLSQRDEYYVQLPHDVFAVLSPADRQGVARWVRAAHDETRLKLSPYLEDSLARSDDCYILAYDLEHLFIPQSVRNYLLASPIFQGKSPEAEAMAVWIGKIQGITLTLSMQETTQATLRIDLQEYPGVETAKRLAKVVDEYLGEAGAHFEELESAEVTVKDRAVLLQTPLSDKSLRQLLALMTASVPALSSPTQLEAYAKTADVERSVAFYRTVMQSLADLEERSLKSTNYLKTAYWVETYAKRIEQLPILGVDPQLLEFSHRTISNLRAIAASLRGVPIQVNTLERAVVYNVNYWPWSRAVTLDMWGNYVFVPQTAYVTSNLAEVRQRQAAVVASGEKEREKVWRMIEDDRYALRRGLAQRLKVDVDAPQSAFPR